VSLKTLAFPLSSTGFRAEAAVQVRPGPLETRRKLTFVIPVEYIRYEKKSESEDSRNSNVRKIIEDGH
jgi:hypothetical protein